MTPILACWNGHLSQTAMMVVGGVLALWVMGSVASLVNLVLIPLANTSARFRLIHCAIFFAYVAPMVTLVTGGKLPMAVGGIALLVFAVFAAPLAALVHLMWLLVLRWRGRKQGSRLPRKPTESYSGPRCVSCRAPISFGVHLCPLCGYTQPEYERTI